MSKNVPPREQEYPAHSIDGIYSTSGAYADSDGDTEQTYIDPATGRRLTIRRRLRRYVELNLLDHKAVIAKEAPAVGASVGTMLQGLLMSSILGIVLAGIGATSLAMTLLGKAKAAAAPFIDITEQWIEIGQDLGLPVDEFKRKLASNMTKHYLPKRCLKYAVFTLFGRGGGSFWLGALSAGVTAAYAPDAVHAAVGLVQSGALLKNSLELAADDIITYRFMHHPDVLAERLRTAAFRYQEVRTFAKGEKISQREQLQRDQREQQTLKDTLHQHTFWMDNLTSTAARLSGTPGASVPSMEKTTETMTRQLKERWQEQQAYALRESARQALEERLTNRALLQQAAAAAFHHHDTVSQAAHAIAKQAQPALSTINYTAAAKAIGDTLRPSLPAASAANGDIVPPAMRSLFEDFASEVYDHAR